MVLLLGVEGPVWFLGAGEGLEGSCVLGNGSRCRRAKLVAPGEVSRLDEVSVRIPEMRKPEI